MSDATFCRSCGAPMLWARTKNDKRIPLDPEPIDGPELEQLELELPAGRIQVDHFEWSPDLDGPAYVVRVLAADVPADPDVEVFLAHFVTCPNR